MAKIFYSVSGEGRGHAIRACAIVESLRGQHDIVIYAPADAYHLLAPVYQDTEVVVRRIPGLCFHYDSHHRLAYWKVGWPCLRYVADLPHIIHRLEGDFESEQPSLVITDFEPSLPRAAKHCGVPFISLDHQHFLVTYDLSSLPPYLRPHLAYMSQVVRAYYSGQVETVVSSFYFPPLRSGYEQVKQIGVLLRPEILEASPTYGSHILAYLRRFASPALIRALQECGCEVRVYGLGARPPLGSVRFCDVDAFRFAEDLATCRALICTAGNQLVGEALYLGKPVLGMPERGNFEQHINGHFLQDSGTGTSVRMSKIAPVHLHDFLRRLDEFRAKIDRERLYGNPKALDIIKNHLPKSAEAEQAA